ncbi:MAG: (Fe-S)-binding protein [Rhodospirillaceae bacterium]
MTGDTSTQISSSAGAEGPRVGLFATCLVDLMRPSVGFAAVKLLQDAGCRVYVPEAQTCCGQPAFNAGDSPDARDIAKQVIETFEGFDYVVAPSGSCGGMIAHHYPALFKGDAGWADRAQALAGKTHELVSFLTDVLKTEVSPPDCAAKATYHDSCSGLRELGIKTQPRVLLNKIKGLSLIEGKIPETCCGFGGLFCVKYPDISERMVDNKAEDIIATGADLLLAGDMGCLMNMAGRLRRKGSAIEVRHVAEVLAGLTDAPGIGDGTGDVDGPGGD